MRATDIFGGPFTPPGFYYKTFIRPRRLWPLYEKVLRHAAGLGVLPKQQADREWRTEYRRRHADVLVIGGGDRGARASAAERAPSVRDGADRRSAAGRRGADADRAAAPAWRSSRGRARSGYFDGIVPVWQGDTLHQIRAAQPRVCNRRDRAAAGVRRQRHARGDAVGRRPPLDRSCTRSPRGPRGGRDDLRPRARRRARAGRRRGGDRRGRRPAARAGPPPRSSWARVGSRCSSATRSSRRKAAKQ